MFSCFFNSNTRCFSVPVFSEMAVLCERIVSSAPASGRYQTWEISARLIQVWQSSARATAEPPDGKCQANLIISGGTTEKIVLQTPESWHSSAAHSLLLHISMVQNLCFFAALFHSFPPTPAPSFWLLWLLGWSAAHQGLDDKSSCSIC